MPLDALAQLHGHDVLDAQGLAPVHQGAADPQQSIVWSHDEALVPRPQLRVHVRDELAKADFPTFTNGTASSATATRILGAPHAACSLLAPARGERTAKYNRLLRIEEELGHSADYPKGDFRTAYEGYIATR